MVTMQRTRNDIDHERAVNLGCLQLHTSTGLSSPVLISKSNPMVRSASSYKRRSFNYCKVVFDALLDAIKGYQKKASKTERVENSR